MLHVCEQKSLSSLWLRSKLKGQAAARKTYLGKQSSCLSLTYIVPHKVNLWQCEGVVQGHEDGRLHCDVY